MIKKMRYLPGFVDLIYFKIINIRNLSADINPKMVINGVPWGPPWPEFGMHLTTIPPKVFLSPKVFNFNSLTVGTT